MNQHTTQGQPNAPQPGTPEYNAMMAARYENQGGQPDPTKQSFQNQPQKAQKPDWLPEKFWDAEKGEARLEALAKSYGELERARSQQKPQQGQPNNQGEQPNDPAKQAAQDAGLNWDDLGVKVMQNGVLDDADYAALEKAGIPRFVVDNVLGAYKVAAQAARARTAEYLGGEEVMNHIFQRAAKELAPEEIDSFNKMLANDKTAKAALDVLKQRFAPSDGEPLGMVFGDSPSQGTEVGFASQYEMVAAMNKRNEAGHKLYEVDPAYRAQVRRRIALSRF